MKRNRDDDVIGAAIHSTQIDGELMSIDFCYQQKRQYDASRVLCVEYVAQKESQDLSCFYLLRLTLNIQDLSHSFLPSAMLAHSQPCKCDAIRDAAKEKDNLSCKNSAAVLKNLFPQRRQEKKSSLAFY